MMPSTERFGPALVRGWGYWFARVVVIELSARESLYTSMHWAMNKHARLLYSSDGDCG